MRVFVTGGAGFIGGAVCRRLRARGDEVIAMVRDIEKAAALEAIGCDVRHGDLSSPEALAGAMRGCDGVIHSAGSYRLGIRADERPAMYDANVTAAIRVLESATIVDVPRVVHVSSVNVLGDTRGRIVDENHRRDVARGFLSYYDETKYLAHVAARELVGSGSPIVIAMPGTTYGPGDRSGLGLRLQATFEGRARVIAFADAGISPVHVDDVAAGIIAALERGRVGESYILAGQNVRMREALSIAARAGGHRPPRLTVPTRLLRATARFGPLLARVAGSPPDLGEVIRAADGVTYWASSANASLKLGYGPRELVTGLRDAFGPR